MRLGRTLHDQETSRGVQQSSRLAHQPSCDVVSNIGPNVKRRIAGNDIEAAGSQIFAKIARADVHVTETVQVNSLLANLDRHQIRVHRGDLRFRRFLRHRNRDQPRSASEIELIS